MTTKTQIAALASITTVLSLATFSAAGARPLSENHLVSARLMSGSASMCSSAPFLCRPGPTPVPIHHPPSGPTGAVGGDGGGPISEGDGGGGAGGAPQHSCVGDRDCRPFSQN